MITEQDLQEAIAECQGQRNPNANTCIKLAAFYTIRRELFGEEKDAERQPGYSYAAPPPDVISFSSGSEFSEAIKGRPQAEVWPVIDELMETVQAIEPRLYNAVMDKLT